MFKRTFAAAFGAAEGGAEHKKRQRPDLGEAAVCDVRPAGFFQRLGRAVFAPFSWVLSRARPSVADSATIVEQSASSSSAQLPLVEPAVSPTAMELSSVRTVEPTVASISPQMHTPVELQSPHEHKEDEEAKKQREREQLQAEVAMQKAREQLHAEEERLKAAKAEEERQQATKVAEEQLKEREKLQERQKLQAEEEMKLKSETLSEVPQCVNGPNCAADPERDLVFLEGAGERLCQSCRLWSLLEEPEIAFHPTTPASLCAGKASPAKSKGRAPKSAPKAKSRATRS